MMKKFLKIYFALLIIFGWLLNDGSSAWTRLLFLPKIPKVLAAQTTIDSSVHTASVRHSGSSPTTVFTSQTDGYAFYVDSNSYCVYSKTTNGGVNWGTAVNVTTSSNCIGISVWYDRWTPEDTTGNLIHIAVIDTTNDDIFYRTLDVSTDTLSSASVNITSGLSYSASFTSGTNMAPSLTKGTDGALYAAASDATDNISVRCTSACTTSTNWAISEPTSWAAGNDFQTMIAMTSNKVMFLWWDISATANDIKYSVWNGSSWSAWGNITTALDNTTYKASLGATVDPSTGDVYLAYANSAATLGTDDDVMVRKYTNSSGSWSLLTDVVTNGACAGGSTCGITGVKIARDSSSGYLYVLYSAQVTAGTASTGNIYWKYSVDGGSTWSSEFGPVYSSNDDIYGARLSLMQSSIAMIYATWYAATPDDLFGRPIAPKTFNQAAYRLFDNSDSSDVGSVLANQDNPATLSLSGSAFRLRLLLQVNVSDLFEDEGSFKLQFVDKGIGSCVSPSGGTPSTYADVSTSTVIAFKNNATPADGDALTANGNDPTHGGDTVVNQTYEELNNFINSIAVIPLGQDGKWDFSLFDNNSSPTSATYCFRIVTSDDNVLDAYDVRPEITTSTTVPSLTLTVDPLSLSVGVLVPNSPLSATSTAAVYVSGVGGGYNLQIKRDDASSTLDLTTDTGVNFPDCTAWDPTGSGNATTSPGANLSFRIQQSGTDANYSSAWWGNNDSSGTAKYAGLPSTSQQIVNCNSGGSCNNGTTTSVILYRLDAPVSQPVGSYNGDITFTALVNP